MSKAAQGFLSEAYFSTSRAETRGERRSSEKGPFMNGNFRVETSFGLLRYMIRLLYK